MTTILQPYVLYRHILHFISAISIKRLTLIGFGLVVLPLAIALLYSVSQVNELAKQGATAVFTVADLNQTNRELSLTMSKMERLAGQFVILNESDLLEQYQKHALHLSNEIMTALVNQNDTQLTDVVARFHQQIESINALLLTTTANELALVNVQEQFTVLASINQEIMQRSNTLIDLKADEIKNSASQVSETMLQSLIIIPISLLISGFFIVLITSPMKALLAKINDLEQGSFEQPIHVTGATEVREIAEALELMRNRLHVLELQKSSFIRHISHELKTPLAAIREGTELIYDNSVGELNDDQQEIVKIIKLSVSRLQCLIEDLLDFNIVLDSTSLQDTEHVQLKPQIEMAIDDRKLDIQRKEIEIDLQIEPAKLQCNTKQLNVILDNLLSNAIKFSPQGGHIRIASQSMQDKVCIEVSDQGPGMNELVLARIFDAFYQGPAPVNSSIKGSGLGLTIVKELLLRLKGEINVQNLSSLNKADTEPNGTMITILLPKVEKER
ncbi:sensor histidine kinase [Thalassotalea atypica]|uniref:sensor histidine kinase n=1 Tax=Thalassotalea atypica TaxID=2054316 RepID=UPI0025738E01|nr:ATP-binding protein [Thalassotalea atypica]